LLSLIRHEQTFGSGLTHGEERQLVSRLVNSTDLGRLRTGPFSIRYELPRSVLASERLPEYVGTTVTFHLESSDAVSTDNRGECPEA
jgi:hypothetical protein